LLLGKDNENTALLAEGWADEPAPVSLQHMLEGLSAALAAGLASQGVEGVKLSSIRARKIRKIGDPSV
jgi:hypothetical protein